MGCVFAPIPEKEILDSIAHGSLFEFLPELVWSATGRIVMAIVFLGSSCCVGFHVLCVECSLY